jgi:hypothetical protein
MEIIGLEKMPIDQLNQYLRQGAKFVVFQYCFSVLILTFKRASAVYFIRPDNGVVGKGLPYTFFSLLFGWWGIPWGPVYTISSILTNLRGGKNVTNEVISAFNSAK